MAKIVITCQGRTFAMDVPEGAEVQLRFDEEVASRSPMAHPSSDALRKVGPSGRKLYRWLAEVVGTGRTGDIDPILVEGDLGLVPIALGRTLGALERAGFIEVIHRRKEDRSRVVSYKVRVLEVSGPIAVDPTATLYSNFCADVREALGPMAESLFKALCREADIDGQTLCASLRSLAMKMVPVPNRVPEKELEQLEHGDWIAVMDTDPLHVTVMAWEMLKKDVAEVSIEAEEAQG